MTRILPDLSAKDIKMTDQTVAATRKKGNRVTIEFLGETGIPAASPGADIARVRATAVETGFVAEISLADLDSTLLMQLAAFGASVHMRNAVNTSEDAEDGQSALDARVSAFRAGSYRSSGRVSGTPLLFQALAILLGRRNADLPDGHPKKRTAEEISANIERRLSEWMAFGKFDDLPEDEAKKALSKHRREIEKPYRALDGITAIMAEIRAARGKVAETTDAADLL